MKICTVVGARPQFIKAAMVSRAIREHNNSAHASPASRASLAFRAIGEVLIHTGQHYDHKMSKILFDQLEIPEPNYHLEIGSGSHGDQMGRMLAAIEKVLLDEKPDAVLVYGDTNSTLAGALAAAKLHIPVGHVEGGMRSFNRRMPEEINRVLTDHIAEWHFCATETAVKNLKAEGITEGVHLVGNVMRDAVMLYRDVAAAKSDILEKLGLSNNSLPFIRGGSGRGRSYALATIHRPENTDDPDRLRSILEALVEISKDMPVVLPLHPRTRKAIDSVPSPLRGEGRGEGGNLAGLAGFAGMKIIDPVSYLDILQLEQHASIILTDSGGMQNEAFWLGVPCVTMRDETEWLETVEAGMNAVVGAKKRGVDSAYREFKSMPLATRRLELKAPMRNASEKCVRILMSCLSENDVVV